MTYDEITRALQCCQGYGRCDCEHCPADSLGDRCDNALLKLAADAIDHLLTDNAALRYAAASKKANRETVPYLRAWVDELCAQKDRMMAENALLRAQLPRWRSVREELPPVGWRVLATACNHVYIAARSKVEDSWVLHGLWGVTNASGNGVTHWMPMPDLPKEG